MVRELTLAKYLVTSQWRELFFSKRASGLLYLILLAALPFVLYKYWAVLQAVAEGLGQENENYNLSILFLLNLICWFVPIWSSQQVSSYLKTTKFFPINFRTLLFVRYITFFLVPVTVFASIFSILSFYPVFYKANFLSSALFSIAVIVFSISVGFAVVNILNLRNGRLMLFGGAILITSGLILSSTSLVDVAANINRLLTYFLSTFLFTPSIFLNMLTAFCLMLLGTIASVVSFKLFWEQEITGDRLPRSARYLRLSGNSSFFIRYGLLLRKDLKDQFRSSFGPYLSILVTIYYAYFLIISSNDTYLSLNVFLSFIFIPQVPIFYNFFGLERISSIERFASFPIIPAELIKIKNLTAVMLSAIALVFLIPVIYLKFSFVVVFGFFLKWCLLTTGYIVVGNFLSIYCPFRRSSSGFPNELLLLYSGVILITSLILILVDSLSGNSVTKANLINAGVLIIYALFYFISLSWNNRYLNGRWENIRKALAK